MALPVSTGYTPRDHQAQVHASLKRFSVLVCHRRFGKTVMCVNQLIDGAMRERLDRPRFAYIGPLFRQVKQAAWDYLKVYTRSIEDSVANEAELRVDLPSGARIQLFGADNPDALRGIYLDGVVLDEYAQMRPKMWTEVIRPALSDRLGWAIFIGTPKGKNAFFQLYEDARVGKAGPEWFAAMYRASETGIIVPEELHAARRDMGDDEYEQEYECSFTAAIQGAYYSKLLEQADKDGRIGSVAYDPRYPVQTAWDLGIGDSTSIWFLQLIGREIRWIDFYEASGVGLDHYAKILNERGYTYGDPLGHSRPPHMVPHDAEARELGTGKARVDIMKTLGIRPRVIPLHSVDDGIAAVRMMLARSWFDAEKCERGLEALRQYRREWDEKGGLFRARPLHDWTSHAADAARYAAMGIKEAPASSASRPDRANSSYSPHRWHQRA